MTVIKHVEEQLTRAKTQLLDHKAASIKQLFKLFRRVDSLI